MGRVLITGASRGIGRSLSYLLAGEGYDLFLIARNSKEMLDELALEVKKGFGVACDAALCDVSDPERVKEVTEEFLNKDKISVLINNAAISLVKLITDTSDEEWRQVIDTNLSSCFYFSRAVIPSMLKEKSGRIINISSVWGSAGASMEVAYSASKGGVNAFTRALAKELAPSGITVNAVAFGMIDTDMNGCYTGEELSAIREDIPADRIAAPLEAAQMILNVLRAPSYMTGQIVSMDGGWQ